ncbi:MAG: UdgX family uracil-DNA binding protein [Jatrophihabitantaceae bacterium]
MAATSTAEPYLPDTDQLPAVARAAADCQGCELYQNATQTVFGRGPADASMMLVGEQPGDVEDQRGEPFVGPAGKLLDRALAEAGVEPDRTYLTNAVKHFRWKPDERSKRRIHQKPSAGNIRACRPWLAAELRAVQPKLVVALGATAAQALLGTSFRLTQNRGSVLTADLDGNQFSVLATVHPSAVLRAPDRDAALTGLVADLRVAAEFVAGR